MCLAERGLRTSGAAPYGGSGLSSKTDEDCLARLPREREREIGFSFGVLLAAYMTLCGSVLNAPCAGSDQPHHAAVDSADDMHDCVARFQSRLHDMHDCMTTCMIACTVC